MSLRFREKQSLYHSLGQLLRSGVTFPAALQKLAPLARGNVRRLLQRLNHATEHGSTVADAFAAQRPAISEMEAGIVAAVERAGRLDRGLEQLAAYFGTLETARASVVKQLAYPVFVLHFGILSLSVPTLVANGLGPYLREVGGLLTAIYAVVFIIALAVPRLAAAAATSSALDQALRCLPVIGALRRDFAVSRFCSTYQMQLEAGVNVMDGLAAAARAGRSGMISGAVAKAVPAVLGGAQVGPSLAGPAFPAAMLSNFEVGEQTGNLSEELERMAEEYRRAAVAKIGVLTEWVPRLLYLATAGYLGYRIVAWYGGYLQQVKDLTDQIH